MFGWTAESRERVLVCLDAHIAPPAESAVLTGLLVRSLCSDPDLPDTLQGKIVRRGDGTTYQRASEQYASPCHRTDGSMQPSAIIYAKGDGDVVETLTWARKRNIKVAVRTGGHQYSGASSTSGPNILLDLSQAYHNAVIWHEGGTVAEVGVSLKLKDLNMQLGKEDTFVPHGQCTHVHVGGHVHTGGYGLPGRAFGLFGDHIQAIRVITPDGPDGGCRGPRWIERNTADQGQADLFWAVLGGSPGNFAVLTHIKLKVGGNTGLQDVTSMHLQLGPEP